MIGLNKIGLNQVQLNQLYLNTLCACKKSSGGDGFPRLPGDVTRWSFKGLTNEQMSKNPRLEDADHKGRFLTFKNFLWDRMSGCNGYSESFSYAFKGSSNSYNTFKSDSEVLIAGAATGIISLNYQKCFFDGYIRVSGLDKIANETTGLTIYLKSQDISDAKYNIKKDGIYKIQIGDINNSSEWVYFWIRPKESGLFSSPVTIEILPNYPGFIIGDGVDDYAVTEKNLDFEDTYTVYTAFIPFQEDPARNMVLCGKSNLKDFYMNYSTLNSINFYSSSKAATVKLSKGFNLIICKRTTDKMIIKNLLANVSIEIDANAVSENPGLYYLWRSLNNATYANAAIAGQVICNGHFTSDEEDTKVLNWYKKEYPWLFFDQAWTVTGKTNEDTDRATITNITGNGNNLVLSNFGFAGNSGYGDYPTLAPKYEYTSDVYTRVFISFNNIKSIRVKFVLTGLLEDNSGKFILRVRNSTTSIYASTYTKDGTYVFTYEYTGEEPIQLVGYNSIGPGEEYPKGNFTVDIIPDHQGYLVTDGVDDMITSSAFQMGKDFTIVGDWKFIDNKKSGTGLVKGSSFYIYNTMIGLDLYINSGSVKNSLDGIKSINAACSDGRAYDRNWNEILANTGNVVGSGGMLEVSSSGGRFDLMAFKNLAIYPRILSKNDCIKAYIYLQTLKAK